MAASPLDAAEFKRRQDALRATLVHQHLDGAVIFSAVRVQYLSGFAHVPTERPVALVLPVAGEPGLLVPQLEEEHVHAQTPWLRRLRVYFEYPGLKHPMAHLADLLAEVSLAGKPLGADSDGYGHQMGYRGPTLGATTSREVTSVRDLIDTLRLVKSPAELDLLRQAGQSAAQTHSLLQAQLRPGRSELDVSLHAEHEATTQLAAALAAQGRIGGAATVHASFRAGPRTAMPHAMMGTRALERGDNIVSYCLGTFSGYRTELERTMFLGQPSPRQRELFAVVLDAQQLALEMLRPGLRCAEVEAHIRDFLVSKGYESFIRHHAGHGLGLEAHEAPFFDLGDQTVLQPGMVFSVEPGLYVSGLGGFRHSDTVALSEVGAEILTKYQRTLDELIIDA